MYHLSNIFYSKEAQLFEECVQKVIDASIALKEDSSKYEVTNKLNSAIDLAKRLSHIDEIYELPHVSADQLFAIFGSLVLPLIAPMIKNVFSEIKRYRDLT